MSNTVKRDNQRALIVKKLAKTHKISEDLIYKVIAGERKNDAVLEAYMRLDEALELLFTNMLAPCLPQIISFKNSKPLPLETISRN